jgi:uncharacterized cysteine cluster protein YcgN (CxxCxxCC family)
MPIIPIIKMTDDDICLACPVRGVCCYFEDYVKGVRIATNKPCEYLDTKTGLCSIYSERHKKHRGKCLSVKAMLHQSTVPIMCLYIVDKEAYRKKKNRRHYKFEE